MANEITLSRGVLVTSGNFSDDLLFGSVLYTLNAIEKAEITIASSVAEADLAIVGVTTPSLVVLKNLDGTDTIIWGPKSGGAMVEVGRIKAKGEAIFELGSAVTIRFKATANTPKLWAHVWG